MLILNLNSELENVIDRKISQQCHCLSHPMDNRWRIGKPLFAFGIWCCVEFIHMPQILLDHGHTHGYGYMVIWVYLCF